MLLYKLGIQQLNSLKGYCDYIFSPFKSKFDSPFHFTYFCMVSWVSIGKTAYFERKKKGIKDFLQYF